MRAIPWSVVLVGLLGLPCTAQSVEATPDEAKLIVETFDREQPLELRYTPQPDHLGDVFDGDRSFFRATRVRCAELIDEARSELAHLLVKEGWIQGEAIVSNRKAGALLTNAAFADHRHDLASRHRVDENRPLFERRSLGYC